MIAYIVLSLLIGGLVGGLGFAVCWAVAVNRSNNFTFDYTLRRAVETYDNPAVSNAYLDVAEVLAKSATESGRRHIEQRQTR